MSYVLYLMSFRYKEYFIVKVLINLATNGLIIYCRAFKNLKIQNFKFKCIITAHEVSKKS